MTQKDYLNKIARGVTFAGLNYDLFKPIEIYCPNLDEQYRITAMIKKEHVVIKESKMLVNKYESFFNDNLKYVFNSLYTIMLICLKKIYIFKIVIVILHVLFLNQINA